MEATVVVLTGGRGSDDGLADVLGAQHAAAVGELRLRRAREWARDIVGGDAVLELPERSFTAALAHAPAAGPLLLVAPDLPRWDPRLAEAALGDLGAGCAMALAPIFDGGLYLLALADPSAGATAALGELDLAGANGMTALVTLAAELGWDVGLLRAERGLRRAADVRALLADPLCDEELRGLLEGWGEGT